eukprot:1003330-Rhodomonas_salina.1
MTEDAQAGKQSFFCTDALTRKPTNLPDTRRVPCTAIHCNIHAGFQGAQALDGLSAHPSTGT